MPRRGPQCILHESEGNRYRIFTRDCLSVRLKPYLSIAKRLQLYLKFSALYQPAFLLDRDHTVVFRQIGKQEFITYYRALTVICKHDTDILVVVLDGRHLR